MSTVLPYAWADPPHELLPIMPPIEQWLCVDGLGPNWSFWSYSWRLSLSSTMPGSTTQVRWSASIDNTLSQYFVQSMTTAVLVRWPPKLVPPPRDSTGAANSAHTATASAPASIVRGTTTPIGTCR